MTSQKRIAKYGNPMTDQARFERAWMILLPIPVDIRSYISCLPQRLYINKDMAPHFLKVMRLIISRGLHGEIKTFDGCFVVRRQRGSKSISTHSFGLAIDFNAAENALVRNVAPIHRDRLRRLNVKWSEAFLNCWREVGFTCGADWITVLDGMHFQWDNI